MEAKHCVAIEVEMDTALPLRCLRLSPPSTQSLALSFRSDPDHVKDRFPSLFFPKQEPDLTLRIWAYNFLLGASTRCPSVRNIKANGPESDWMAISQLFRLIL